MTNDSIVDDIVDLLPRLTAAELAEVEKRVTFLRRSSTAGNDPASGLARDLVQTIIDTLRDAGLPTRAQSELTARGDWNAFAEKARAIDIYIDRTPGLTKVEKQAILNLGVRLLADRLAVENRQVSFNALLAEVHRVPTLLDREFPDYAQNGLLHMLVRAIDARPPTRL